LTEWQGDNPFFLYVRGVEDAVIDLDEPRWKETFAEVLARPGTWQLIKKSGSVVIEVVKESEDLLTYASRVFVFPALGDKQLRAYGFKRDGAEVWYMPWSGLTTDGYSVTRLANEYAFRTWGQVQLSTA
jgi:hypothetical protein